jgi:hypothetical protein
MLNRRSFITGGLSLAPAIYAGGVVGMRDLLDPANSERFRQRGGGLYLHSTAWGRLNGAERQQILQLFQGHPIAIELGFGNGDAWGRHYTELYGHYRLTPTFIAVNVFGTGRPTLKEWRAYIVTIRRYGIPAATPIAPVMAPNRRPVDLPLLSASPEMQAFAAEGIVLDTPPGFALKREPAYRQWVVDAIHWADQLHILAAVILSPWSSRTRWPEDTDQFLRFLRLNGAKPTDFVCENYESHESSDYPNRVGGDAVPYSVIGNCDHLF